ncbi:tyrosine-type recombinase/integrase [Pseudomonas putida]|uniref:tyrosine-type recombinase/integrase n=1 Tax=Pseudomonas putida TaxID=303 RepID=UPI003AF3BC86
MAMEWGFAERNPCLAVRRNKEKVRDFYAADEIWDAVYAEGDQGLKDAMDLAYLAGQRPADTLKFSTVDLDDDYLWVDQNKTDKKLRIRRHINGELTGLGRFIESLLERRKLQGVRNSRLITNDSGLRMSWEMLRNRFSEARDKAARKLTADGNTDLAGKVRQFQFRDIRPKAASEIEDIGHASRLLGHSKEEITKRVYRRVGEVVSPTK